MKLKLAAGILSMLFLSIGAFAQTTSVIQGTVTDEAGQPLPGVVVTIESASLQGDRQAVSRPNGQFLFRLLPPGAYTATLTMEGMQTRKVTVDVGLNQTSRPSVVLKPASASEEMVVVASGEPVLDTTSVTAHFEKDFVDKLASGRDQRSVALLAPGTTAKAYGSEVAISGAPTHANSYLVNGADARFDNLRGGPANTVIEDAVQETTILTSAISAEYGNFGGGVISSITKSGGNEFTGSFRVELTNADWRSATPIEKEQGVEFEDEVNDAFSATIGGPIIKDRLWFFVAGYQQETASFNTLINSNPLPDSVATAYGLPTGQTGPGIRPIDGRKDTDDRWEIKLTGKIAEGHDLIVSYQDREDANLNRAQSGLDETAIQPSRTITRTALSVNYRGIINDKLSLDLMYTERESNFLERPTDFIEGDQRITGTLLRDRRTFGYFNSSLFLGKPDEPRGNETYRIKANYFLISDNAGTHDIVVGYEDFMDYRTADNRQSLNDWQFWSDVRYDANDNPIGIYSPTSANGRYTSIFLYYPIENPSLTSDLSNQSIFINDNWTLNEKWRFNIGARYDDRDALAEDGTQVAADSSLSPRLSLEYDLRGDGKHGFSASYSRYTQRTGQGSQDVSQAGSPSLAALRYFGPQVEGYLNVIDWFNSTYGADFFLDPLNHPNTNAWRNDLWVNNLYEPGSPTQVIGAVNPNGGYIPGTLDSPFVDEVRLGYKTRWGSKAWFKADLIDRDFGDFYIDNTNLITGATNNGLADLNVINNDDDGFNRNYHAVQLQGSYRFSDSLILQGNYTWSQLYGNINAESSSGVSSTEGTTSVYPEWNNFEQRNPSGYLPADIRHNAKLFLIYDLNTNFGNFNFSATQRFESGTPYSATMSIPFSGGLDVAHGFPAAGSLGYISPPTSTTYWVRPRGEFRADDITQTNLGINWEISISKLDFFVQFEVFNLFNEDGADRGDGYNSGVTWLEPFNVFTETPVEGVHYQFDDDFGTPGSIGAYQTTRQFTVDFGLRF
jgi:hypothetical protein